MPQVAASQLGQHTHVSSSVHPPLALRTHMATAVEQGMDLGVAVKSFDAAPFQHLKHVEVWLPQLANRTYLEMELE